ncbi:unnamed protein product, partial [Brenthis ino]
MSSRSIPATAANLIKTNQLCRRYYSVEVYAQIQVHSLFLFLLKSDGHFDMTGAQALHALRGTAVEHRQLPNSGILLRIS